MTLDGMILYIVILLFSAVVHEVMHGVAADSLGDKTARYAGRLTLNPFPHIDLFGSLLLPALFLITHSPIFFAYAKPVPYNPYNLRPGRFSEAIVAAAGPLSNVVIAILFGLLIRMGITPVAHDIFAAVVIINLMLCFFNLIPIPPLDGSKVMSAILPSGLRVSYDRMRDSLEANPLGGMIIAVFFVTFFGSIFYRWIFFVSQLVTG